MNGSAIDKGFMRAQVLKKYQEEIKKNPASSQTGIFMKPDRNKVDNLKGKEDANYDKLGADGYAKAETYIKDGDVIIGMVNPKASVKEDEKPYTDNSTIYNSVIPGAVDRVFTGQSGDGYPIIKMRVRSERIPGKGDKFATLSGQKGVVSWTPHRADMPYSEDGLVPDEIINPNAMRRMTVALLIEGLFGNLCAIKAQYGDGTPFMGIDIEEINKELVARGMEDWGNRTMYSGMTGHKFKTRIFFGPVYYQRLKQMVGDKVHSRSNIGPRQLLTHQPTDGRFEKMASVESKISASLRNSRRRNQIQGIANYFWY
jgi:DNA-directed RNA polymerase II subunit RPB2